MHSELGKQLHIQLPNHLQNTEKSKSGPTKKQNKTEKWECMERSTMLDSVPPDMAYHTTCYLQGS